MYFRTLIFLLNLTLTVTAAPSHENDLIARQTDRWITQYWGSETANFTWQSGEAGKYTVTWNNPSGGNFVVGKGHRPARDMPFNYSGTYELGAVSNSYLGLYGWTLEPLVEYYVIESFGVHHPADNRNSTCYGTFESDGGTYEVWMKWRVNAPSIIGTATFPQYWSVRTKRHVGGTITTGNHYAAWERAGLPLGSHDGMGMVIGIEGQWGTGEADITAGVRPTTSVPETPTPTTRTEAPVGTNTCTTDLS